MLTLVKTFLQSKKGTPSIETVAIVAFIALAIFTNLDSLGAAVGSVFDFVKTQLTDQIK
jgi:Flp pilus assembly pilin Flp